MITTADLKSQTKADLARRAKRLGVPGFSSMLKDELVNAVAKAERSKARKSSRTTGSSALKSESKGSEAKSKDSVKQTTRRTTSKLTGTQPSSSAAKKQVRRDPAKSETAKPRKVAAKKKVTKPTKPTSPKVLKRIRELQLQNESTKDISFQPTMVQPPGATEAIWEKEPQQDRAALFVRDAYWMHATWDITRQAVDRAKAALAEQWHAAKPTLRLLRVDDESGTKSEVVERDIPIHGGLRNWYIDWTGEEATFRVMVGYATPSRFHCICESNVVRTPAAGSSDDVDRNWVDASSDAEHVFALSGGYDAEYETRDLKAMMEDRLHRELGAPALARLGASAQSPFKRNDAFHFDMNVELVAFGSTQPDAYLTINEEPVKLREDGSFALRLPFPDRRQVLPAIARSRDGSQERMIVIAVERNTKVMEPLEREQGSGD